MVSLSAAFMAVGALADDFGSGENAFTLDFVNIGYAGNTADFTGYGEVADSYRMGKHEITIDQFATARAADNRIGDGDENIYSIGVNGAATRTTWLDGAKFANWLTTGDAYTGAYQFNGSGTLTAVDRAAAVSTYGTVYVLPTENEWYKAAYLKSDGSGYTLYAAGDTPPTAGAGGENYNAVNSTPWDVGSGIAENNGTFDMNGNAREWNESAWDGTLDSMSENRVIRGGAFNSSVSGLWSPDRMGFDPAMEDTSFGFRVVAIPEPSSLAMVGMVGGLGLFIRRKLMM